MDIQSGLNTEYGDSFHSQSMEGTKFVITVLKQIDEIKSDEQLKKIYAAYVALQKLNEKSVNKTQEINIEPKNNSEEKKHFDPEINGWISTHLPEDWRGELETQRNQWYLEGESKIWIRIKTVLCLLDCLKAYIQIQIGNAIFKDKFIR